MSEPSKLSEAELRSRRAKAETMVLKCISIDSRPAGSDTLPLLDHIDAQAEEIRRLTVLADLNLSEFEQVKELQANMAVAREEIRRLKKMADNDGWPRGDFAARERALLARIEALGKPERMDRRDRLKEAISLIHWDEFRYEPDDEANAADLHKILAPVVAYYESGWARCAKSDTKKSEEIRRLREALEPFVEFCRTWEDDWTRDGAQDDSCIEKFVEVGWFRRAAKAMETQTKWEG